MKQLTFIVVVLFFTACNNNTNNAVEHQDTLPSVKTKVVVDTSRIIEPVDDNEVKKYESNGITLKEIKATNHLGKLKLLDNTVFAIGKTALNFEVQNIEDYKLNLLFNNYTSISTPGKVIETDFYDGNNVFLAYLTQNNISIKSNTAYVLKNVILGNNESLFEMGKPHVFYLSPSNTVNKAVLDFYLLNTTISEQGNKVKVTINDAAVFLLDKWAAYSIEGLTNTENYIRLQLVNNKGDLIDSPFNDSGTRKFIINKTI